MTVADNHAHHLLTLTTASERARYLLEKKFTVGLDIVDLTPVARAYVGGISTPIVGATGETDEQIIARAKAWLQKAVA
ncbi:hypothetical protein [Aeromonas sp. 1HA1]|uniref:hypothetical protein n=1 Tax=Aeromonas sp. 1HA1 TaxID=2699193 RepID=UPI0023DD9018|nr:hypothetical protein [Aeromonas sp. 1HA1]MDF2415704.1 hypothetical protein [Aeromonas sp. 1HA1]